MTVRIDYAGADVYDEITVVKMIDLATGQTVYASWDTALAYDSDGARGSFVQVRECIAAKSTGTKKVIAFYRPGGVEPREECETSGDLFSNRCMPRPGDVVAVYANNDKARTNLGWNPAYGLDQMMETAWNWELAMGRKAGK